MDRKTRWRTFWLGLATALAVVFLIPTLVPSERLPLWFQDIYNKRIIQGLDLQGGLHIVYSLDLDRAVDDRATDIRRDLETVLEERGTDARVLTPRTPLGAVDIVPGDGVTLDAQALLGEYDDMVERRECAPERPEGSICIRVSRDYASQVRDAALEQAILIIRERINERGVAEPQVVRRGDQIIVELPGLGGQEVDRVKAILERTARLEFKVVEEDSPFMRELYRHVDGDERAQELGIGTDVEGWVHDDSGREYSDYFLTARDRTEYLPEEQARQYGCIDANAPRRGDRVQCTISGRVILQEYLDELAAQDPKFRPDDDFEIGFEFLEPRTVAGQQTEERWRTYYLRRQVELAGSAIRQASVVFNPTTNTPEVLVEFNRWGARRFGELTSQNVGRKMAIILDERVNSAPTIQSAILGGRSTITMGGGTVQEQERSSQDLVNVLRTGSLPAPLEEQSSSVVGPLLGQDAVDRARLSFMIGALLVAFAMIAIYRFSGVISLFALSLNILFMLAVLAALGATLTLPGIAAIVLTLGMAVDANIIIFERIREELRTGKSVRGAVDAGFSKGFSAIVDAQITSFVAGYVLYQYGSGPIRGFAIMLLIGIACTLFTATWCSRLFFQWYVGRGRKADTISI
jgi:preprotein translocase subunit SecD